MIQPLKYAVIPGFIFYLLFALQLISGISELTKLRWCLTTCVLIIFILRQKARLTVEYRTLWFSSFNDLIATLLVAETFVFIGAKTILPIDQLQDDSLLIQIILIEYGAMCFLGLIFITLFSFYFSKRKKYERF